MALTTEQYAWLSWIAPVVPIVFGWLRFRKANFQLRQGKRASIRKLLAKRDWEEAHPLTMQMAVEEALGQMLDNRWIQLALRRHNPWGLLVECKRAIGFVTVADKSDYFSDSKPKRRITYRNLAKFFTTAALSPCCVIWIVTIFRINVTNGFGILIVLSLVTATPFFLWMASCCVSAHRLMHELDVQYPMIGSSTTAPASRSERPVSRVK